MDKETGTRRERWPPERIDKVIDSERKDNAGTKNHENFRDQDALPILWAHCYPFQLYNHFLFPRDAPHSRIGAPTTTHVAAAIPMLPKATKADGRCSISFLTQPTLSGSVPVILKGTSPSNQKYGDRCGLGTITSENCQRLVNAETVHLSTRRNISDFPTYQELTAIASIFC